MNIRLPVTTSVRECATLQQQLLELVDVADTVTVDVGDIELIDTAALQLLFAFSRERSANGLHTVWQGDNPALRQAADSVGLQFGDSGGVGAPRECKHEP